ncbi:MAG: pyruvate ferredoxin oxidoreductase, partial [Deferrisomatales bacterium]
MRRVLEGSHAVSEAVELARVQVISAYPITPQTHIVERLAELVADGVLDARYIRVESEHSALAAVIGSASTGVRSFTASSSHGLALMHEMLHWAAGARLPIVMAEVNRAMGPGWNIWADQTDSLAQRDTGWMQLYCEDVQEVLDTILVAYKLAERVSLPAMVAMDAFFLSHTYEPVDVPDQAGVDEFLPPWRPTEVLDPAEPRAFNQLSPPDHYLEFRYKIQSAMEAAVTAYREVDAEFGRRFGRSYGALEVVPATPGERAPLALLTVGSITGTARATLPGLAAAGKKVDLVKLKLFRPFPHEEVRRVLGGYERVAVVDRNISFGFGGIFAQEVRASLANLDRRPVVYPFVAGLGGRDVT